MSLSAAPRTFDFAIGCRYRRSKLRLCDKVFESFNVSAIVTRTIDRRLGNEGRVRQSQIVEQDSKSLFADRSLPNLLVTVEFRSARSFRVITVPDLHVIQADRGIKMLQRFIESSLADDVVSGNVRVARVDARANRNYSAQAIHESPPPARRFRPERIPSRPYFRSES